MPMIGIDPAISDHNLGATAIFEEFFHTERVLSGDFVSPEGDHKILVMNPVIIIFIIQV